MNGIKTFYNSITRRHIIGFATIFRDTFIFRKDKDKNIVQKVIVPITYAPKSKYLARTLQEPDIEGKPFEVTLPRMSFEILSFNYDASRKLNSYTKNTTIVNNQYRATNNGVPYNLQFGLYIYAKQQEDALQILEQILPMFPPTYNLTMRVVPEANITQTVPVTLNSVDYEDNYEGDYFNHRTIVYTLTFNVQVNYFGAIEGFTEDICGTTEDGVRGIIRRTEANIHTREGVTVPDETIVTQLNPFFANPTDDYTVDEFIEGLGL